MATNKQYTVIVTSSEAADLRTHKVAQHSGDKGKALRIKAKAGETYQLVEQSGQAHSYAPQNVKVKRVGKDLVITFEGDSRPDIIIEGYYDVMPKDHKGLIGEAEDGNLYEYIPEDPHPLGLVQMLPEGGQDVAMALGAGEIIAPAEAAIAAFPLLGALGLLGGAAAVAAINNNKNNGTTVGTTGKLSSTSDNTDGGGIVDNKTHDNTPTLTGTAPVGSTATVTINGTTYPVTVAADGSWTFQQPTNLPDGTYYPVLHVTQNGVTKDTNITPFTIDTVPPAVAITSSAAALASGQTSTITFTLSEATSDFTAADVAVTGGTLSNFQRDPSNPLKYTATFTPDSTGTSASIHVDSGKFSDAAGNFNTDGSEADNTLSLKTNATVTGALTPNAPNDSGTLGDNITNDNTPTINGKVPVGSTATVTINGVTYPVTVNADGTYSFTNPTGLPDGTYTPILHVTTGGTTTDNNLTPFTIDTVPPSIAVVADTTALVAGKTANVTFTLSEPVADFTAADVQVTGGTLSNFVQSATDPKVYTATFTPSTSSTSATISVASTKFSDAAGNFNTDGADANNTVTLATNTTASGHLAPASDNATGIPNDNKTNDSTPELAGNVPAGSTATVTIGGQTYPVTVNPDGSWSFTQPTGLPDGTYQPILHVTTGGVTTDSNITPFTIDTVPPTVAITSPVSTLAAGQSTTVTFTLSEASTDLTQTDIQVTGGTLGTLQQSATNPLVYTATFTASAGTGASVHIASGTFSDAAGNLNTDGADADNTWTWSAGNNNASSAKTALSIDPITGDNVVLLSEQGATTLAVTGHVTGKFAAGDLVTLVLNGHSYTATAAADGSYSAVVSMADIKADPDTKIEGTVTGSGGDTATAAQDYTLESGNTPTQTALSIDPVTADNVISAAENTGSINITGHVTGKYAAGDTVTLTVNGHNYTGQAAADGSYSIAVTAADLSADSDTQVDGTVKGTGGTTASAYQNYALDSSVTPTPTPPGGDTTPPTIVVSRTNTGATTLDANSHETILFTLSEASTNFDSGDINVTGGTLSNFTPVASSGTAATGYTQYTAVFTPTAGATGTATVGVASGRFTDNAGNANQDTYVNPAPTGASYESNNQVSLAYDTRSTNPVDNDKPTVQVSIDKTTLASGQSATLTFILSEPSSDFTLADVDVVSGGGTLSNLVAVPGSNGVQYTATYTAASTAATVIIGVDASKFSDAAGNFNADTYKGSAPGTSAVSGTSAEPNNYVTLTNTGSTDNVPPTIVVSRAGAGTVSATGETVYFTLSEPSTDFTQSDVDVTGGSLSNWQQIGPNQYSATYTPSSNANGTATIAVSAGKFHDAAGNQNLDTYSATADTVTSHVVEANNEVVLSYDTRTSPSTPDTTAPTIAISATKSTLASGETSTVTFTLSEASTDFTQSDVQVAGGTLSGWTQVNATTWTATYNPTTGTQGTGSVHVDSNQFRDAAGNYNQDGAEANNTVNFTTNNGNTVPTDTTPPTIIVERTHAGTTLTTGTTETITFTLSEASTNFDATDINVTGGTLSNFTPVPTSGTAATGYTQYTAVFTPAAGSTGTAYVGVASGKFSDNAGNLNQDTYVSPAPTGASYESNNQVSLGYDTTANPAVDTVKPTIQVAIDKTTLSSGQSATLTFILSEPSTDFTLADVTVISGGGTLSNLVAVPGSNGAQYTATYTAASTAATVIIGVDASKFSDAAGNFNADTYKGSAAGTTAVSGTSAETNNYVTLTNTGSTDTTPPTVVVSRAGSGTVSATGETVYFTLSEASTDFTQSDVDVTGGSLSNWTAVPGSNGTQYSATFTPTSGSNGTATIGVSAGKFHDAANNQNLDTYSATADSVSGHVIETNNIVSLAYDTRTNPATPDTTAPTIAISADHSTLSSGQSATVTFTLSEASSDFTQSDVAVTGGTLSNWSQLNATTWTATYTPTSGSQGTGSVHVDSNQFRDAAGNYNQDGAEANNTVNFITNYGNNTDTTPPTVAITSNQASLATGQSATITFTLSEASNDFSQSSVTVSGGSLSNWQHVGVNAQGQDIYTATFTPIANSTAPGVVEIAAGKFHDTSNNQNLDTYSASADSVANHVVETNNIVSMTVDTRGTSAAVVATNDTATALEAGGTSNATLGTDPTGNVLTNDTTTSGSVVVSSISNGTNSSNVTAGTTSSTGTTLAGQYGTLHIGADGSYSYVVNNSNAQVQALRTSADHLTDTFTYTASSGTGTDNANLTITINGANDAPTVVNTLSNQSGVAGQAITPYVVPTTTFNDVDNTLYGETATYSATLSSGAALSTIGLAFDPTTRTFTGTPTTPGTYTIRVTDTDALGLSASTTFNLVVSAGQLDTTPPTIAVTRTNPAATSLDANSHETILFTLSEASTTFDSGDIAVTGGTLSNFTPVPSSGTAATGYTQYTAVFTPAANSSGTATIGVASGTFADNAGNLNQDTYANPAPTGAIYESNNQVSLAYDTTNTHPLDTDAPTVQISVDKASLAAGQSATLSFILSEPSTDFTLADVTVISGGGTVSNLQEVAGSNGTQYTATYTAGSTATTVRIGVAENTFHDAAGNVNTDTYKGSTTGYSTPSGTTYEANNWVQLTNTGSTDTTPPTVVVSRAGSGTVSATGETVYFTLSEASTDFTQSDVDVTGGSLSNWTAVPGSNGTQYSATFTPTSASNGTATIGVSAGKFHDAANNQNLDTYSATADSVSGHVIETNNIVSLAYDTRTNPATPDTTAPTIAISADHSTLSSGQSATVTFTLSEASSDFTQSDVAVTGGTLSNWSQLNATTWTATYTPTSGSQGTGSVHVDSNQFRDAAGNYNQDGAEANNTVNFITNYGNNTPADTTPPTIVVERLGSGTLTSSETIQFTVSEATKDFTLADIDVTGGTLSNLAAIPTSGTAGTGFTTYVATFTPTANATGLATIGVSAGKFSDAAGNLNLDTYSASADSVSGHIVETNNQVQISYNTQGNPTPDTTPPTVIVGRADANTITSGGTETVTFTLSEPSLTFDQSDVTVSAGQLINWTIVPSSGTPAGGYTVYTATWQIPNSGSGTATVGVLSDKFTDLSGNLNKDTYQTGVSGTTWEANNKVDIAWDASANDTTPPTVEVLRSATGTITGPETIYFNFSEATTDFALSDISATGGTMSNLVAVTGSGNKQYIATFTPNATSQGTATIAVAAGTFSDAAGNFNKDTYSAATTHVTGEVVEDNNIVSASFDTTHNPVDTTPPTVAISRVGTGAVTGTDTIVFVFSEPVTGFTLADVVDTSNGSAATSLSNLQAVAGSNNTQFTATYTAPTGSVGSITLGIAANKFADTTGNQNLDTYSASADSVSGHVVEANNQLTLAWNTDTTTPTIAITSSATSVSGSGTATITFTLSEGSSDFAQSMVDVVGGTLSNWTHSTTNPLVYTATFTPNSNSQGTATIGVDAGKFHDLAGNLNQDTYRSGYGSNSQGAGTSGANEVDITYDTRNGTFAVANDTATAVEAGGTNNGTAGTDLSVAAASGLLSNDSGSSLSVTAIKLASASSSAAVSSGSTSASSYTTVVGQYGTLHIGADGSYTYTVDNTNATVQALKGSTNTLSEVFTYTASGTAGGTAQTGTANLTITIQGTNDAPVAVADTATAVEAGGVSNAIAGINPAGNVLINDTDVDSGDTKTVSAIHAGSATGTGGDVVVTTSSTGATATGTYGTINIGADGSYVYTMGGANVEALLPTDHVTDVFTYTVKDAGGLTSQATITVNVTGANDAPLVQNALVDQTATTGSAFSYTFAGNTNTSTDVFKDVDNGHQAALTYSATLADGSSLPSWLSFNASTRTFSGTPPMGTATGTIAVKVVATDPLGLTASDNFNITLGAGTDTAPPTVAITSNQASLSTGQTATITFTLSEASNDFSQSSVTVSGGSLSNWQHVGINAQGQDIYTATFTPTASSTAPGVVEIAAGKFHDVAGNQNLDTYSASADSVANHVVETNNIVTMTVNTTPNTPTIVTVNDTATVGEAGGTANATAGSALTSTTSGVTTLNVLANDTGTSEVVNAISNGSTTSNVTAGTTSSNGTSIAGNYGTLHIGADGSYSYTVSDSNTTVQALRTSSDKLYDVFTYTGAVGSSTSNANLTITITGANDAPVGVNDTATAVEKGGTANASSGIDPTGNVLTNDTDVDSGDTKTVSAITGGTVGSALAGQYGSLTLNPDGSYSYVVDNSNTAVQALRTSANTLHDTFTYTVTDAAGATSTATLDVTVQGANDAPTTIGTLSNTTGTVGTAITDYVVPTTGLFADVDSGDTSTLSATLANGQALSTIGLAWDATNHKVTGTPTAAGTYTIIVKDTDAGGLSTTASFDIVVAATAPTTNTVTITQINGDGAPLTPPTLTITDDQSGVVANSGTTAFTFTFTTAVNGFTSGDVKVKDSNGNTLTFTPTGTWADGQTTYTGTVAAPATGAGSIAVYVEDGSYSASSNAQLLGTGNSDVQAYGTSASGYTNGATQIIDPSNAVGGDGYTVALSNGNYIWATNAYGFGVNQVIWGSARLYDSTGTQIGTFTPPSEVTRLYTDMPTAQGLNNTSFTPIESGGFVAAWVVGAKIFVAQYDNSGTMITPATQADTAVVTNAVGSSIGNSYPWYGRMGVTPTQNGNYVLAYEAADGVYALEIDHTTNAKVTGTTPVKISSAAITSIADYGNGYGGFDIVTLEGGNIVVSWYQNSGTPGVQTRVLDAHGVPLSGMSAMTSLSSNGEDTLQVEKTQDGGFIVLSSTHTLSGYRTGYVKAVKYAVTGNTVTLVTTALVSPDPAGTSNSYMHPRMAQLANGNIVVVWAEDYSGHGAYYRIYDSNMNPLGAAQAIANTDISGLGTQYSVLSHTTVTALPDGGFVIGIGGSINTSVSTGVNSQQIFFKADGSPANSTGSTGANTIVGGDGNDTLTGGGGADIILAGSGNDTVVINASNISNLTTAGKLIDGGTGIDTLKIGSDASTLDLSKSAVQANVQNFEKIDLGADAVANTVILNATAVQRLATQNLDGSSGNKQLIIDGTSSDAVKLSGQYDNGILAGYWTQSTTTPTRTVGGITYKVYTISGLSNVEVLVNNAISTLDTAYQMASGDIITLPNNSNVVGDLEATDTNGPNSSAGSSSDGSQWASTVSSNTSDTTPLVKGILSQALTGTQVLHLYRTDVTAGGTQVEIATNVATTSGGTVSGTSWQFQDSGLTAGHQYTYTAKIMDGNTMVDTSNTYTINEAAAVNPNPVLPTTTITQINGDGAPLTPPTLTISDSTTANAIINGYATTSQVVRYHFDFSTNVSGFALTDISFIDSTTGVAVPSANIGTLQGSGASYYVDVTMPSSGSGAVAAIVKDGSYSAASNAALLGTGNSYVQGYGTATTNTNFVISGDNYNTTNWIGTQIDTYATNHSNVGSTLTSGPFANVSGTGSDAFGVVLDTSSTGVVLKTASTFNMVQGGNYTLAFDARILYTANPKDSAGRWVLLDASDNVVTTLSGWYATAAAYPQAGATLLTDSFQNFVISYDNQLGTGNYKLALEWSTNGTAVAGNTADDIAIDRIFFGTTAGRIINGVSGIGGSGTVNTTIIGGAQADNLSSLATGQTVMAGDGNDTVTVNATSIGALASNNLLDGNTGIDTLKIGSDASTLDLSKSTVQANVQNFEKINLGTDAVANTVILNATAVQRLATQNLDGSSGNKQLIIDGTSSDAVKLSGQYDNGILAGYWTQSTTTPTRTVGGITYKVYTISGLSNVEVLVNNAISTLDTAYQMASGDIITLPNNSNVVGDLEATDTNGPNSSAGSSSDGSQWASTVSSSTSDTTPLVKGILSQALTGTQVLHLYRTDVTAGGTQVEIATNVATTSGGTVSGTSWQFQDSGLTAGHQYTYTAKIMDGNTMVDTSNTYTINEAAAVNPNATLPTSLITQVNADGAPIAAPTLTITDNQSGIASNSASTTFTFNFSAAVSGFDLGDVTFIDSATGNTITIPNASFSGSGSTYTAVVAAPASGAGNILVKVADGVADLASNTAIHATGNAWSQVYGANSGGFSTAGTGTTTMGLDGRSVTLTNGNTVYLGSGPMSATGHTSGATGGNIFTLYDPYGNPIAFASAPNAATGSNGEYYYSDAVAMPNGEFAIFTTNTVSTGGGQFTVFGADGQQKSAAPIAFTTGTRISGVDYNMTPIDAAVTSDGNFVVLYTASTGTTEAFYYKIINGTTGANIGSPVQLSANNSVGNVATPASMGDVVKLSDGKIAMVWEVDGTGGGGYQILNADGSAIAGQPAAGSPVSDTRGLDTVALSGGGFAEVIGHIGSTELYIYSASGARGPQIVVNSANYQTGQATVTQLTNGNIAVAYGFNGNAGNNVYVKFYDAAGNYLSTITAGQQTTNATTLDINATADGGFYLTYTPMSLGYTVQQQFDSSGASTSISSTANNATLPGGDGSDTISAFGANQVVIAGAGDDTVNVNQTQVSSLTTGAYLNGGTGFDTLALSGTGITLDLASPAVAANVKNFELINLGATSANTLNLNVSKALELAQGNPNTLNQLFVRGGSSDVLNLSPQYNNGVMTGTWSVAAGTTTVNGVTYKTYTYSGDTTFSVLVESTLTNVTTNYAMKSSDITASLPSGTVVVGDIENAQQAAAADTTTDTTPLVSGNLSAALTSGQTLKLYRTNVTDGGSETLVATLTPSGSNNAWSYQEATALTAGKQYKYVARVSDGTHSVDSNAYSINVAASGLAGGGSSGAGGSTSDPAVIAPTLTITDNQPSVAANASTVKFAFDFSEAVTTFDASDITVTNGTKGTFTAIDASHYTLDVTMPTSTASASGSAVVSVASGSFVDATGTAGIGASATQQYGGATTSTFYKASTTTSTAFGYFGSTVKLTNGNYVYFASGANSSVGSANAYTLLDSKGNVLVQGALASTINGVDAFGGQPVAMANGEFALFYKNGFTIFNATGTVKEAHTTSFAPTSTVQLEAAQLGNGEFAVIYAKGDGYFYYQTIHQDGTAGSVAETQISVSGAGPVNSTILTQSYYVWRTAATTLPNGKVALLWENGQQGGYVYLNSDGTKEGPATVYAMGDQPDMRDIQLITLQNGGMAEVSYFFPAGSAGQTAQLRNLVLNIYSPDGSRGRTIEVDNTNYGSQDASVAQLTNGNIVVVGGTGANGGYLGFAKIYTADGTYLETVNLPTATGNEAIAVTALDDGAFSVMGLAGGVPVQYIYKTTSSGLSLMGTSGIDTLAGSDGADTITGLGGADKIYAAGGDDTVVLNADNITQLGTAGSGAVADGGSGNDTLKLSGSGITLDLTNVTLGNNLMNFEKFDITGSGNNVIKLNVSDVLQSNMTAAQAGVAGDTTHTHVVQIDGDAGDIVNLNKLFDNGSTTGTWSTSSTATVGTHTYNVYSYSADPSLQVLIDSHITSVTLS